MIERFTGALLGLAAGDSVGAAVEFKAPGTFPPLTDMIGGGPFHLQPGQWTDDTSMALCLADSLIACNGFDARDQMQRYCRWYLNGYMSSIGRCFDIGNTTRLALHTFQNNGEPFSGSTSPSAAGNGSLMRLAPAPLWFAADEAQAVHWSGESSRTTHGARTAIDACRYFGALLVRAVHGSSKEAMFSAPWPYAELDPQIDEIAAGSFQRREPPQIVGSGFVVRSLEAALWAFWKSCDFEHGCLLAANLGDDADTTAAIYGQVAGAFYGADGIPARWREKLALRETIEEFGATLARHAGV